MHTSYWVGFKVEGDYLERLSYLTVFTVDRDYCAYEFTAIKAMKCKNNMKFIACMSKKLFKIKLNDSLAIGPKRWLYIIRSSSTCHSQEITH